MAHTITVNAKTLEHVVSQLDTLTKEVKELKEKLLDQEPPYGSDAWWEWSDKKALEDIKKGDYIEFKSAKDMVNHLKKL